MGTHVHGGGGQGGTAGRTPLAASYDFATILKELNLAQPDAELFSRKAEAIAKTLQGQGRNTTTQIRRFYNEMLRYRAEFAQEKPDNDVVAKFKDRLPFIKMLNAYAAYSKERKLVDEKFTDFLRAMLDKVDGPATLKNACTLFEAVIGFSSRK